VIYYPADHFSPTTLGVYVSVIAADARNAMKWQPLKYVNFIYLFKMHLKLAFLSSFQHLNKFKKIHHKINITGNPAGYHQENALLQPWDHLQQRL
jgi:hypothetical protein